MKSRALLFTMWQLYDMCQQQMTMTGNNDGDGQCPGEHSHPLPPLCFLTPKAGAMSLMVMWQPIDK